MAIRLFKLAFGLFLFSASVVMTINTNLGMAPWDIFHTGISYHTGLTLGQVIIALSFLIIIFNAVVLKMKVGIGTLANFVLVGSYVDMINAINIIPKSNSVFTGLLELLAAIIIMSLGLYLYIGAALGAGPRDSLFIGLSKLVNKPAGLIKSVVEITVTVLGVMLGAKFGVGTVIFAFGSGYIMQLVFKLLHFDVKAVNHEYLDDIVNKLKN